MNQHQQTQLDEIIASLESIQAQAPTKTTYTMGRADHSLSRSLLDIIRRLKAFSHDAASEPEPVTDGISAGTDSITSVNADIVQKPRK